MSPKPFEWTVSRRRTLLDAIVSGAKMDDAARLVGTTGRTAQRHARRDSIFGGQLADAVAEREARRERVGCGTATRYATGCRCPLCREAHRQAVQKRRRERVGLPVPNNVEHGNASTYGNWNCRCEPCTKAHSARCRDYDARRRAFSA